MKIKDNLIKNLANEFVVPVIINMIDHYSVEELQQAINSKTSLAAALQTEPETLLNIKKWASLGSLWFNEISKVITTTRWIDWFVSEPLKQKRPDLWAILTFQPHGKEWFYAQTKELADLILS